MLTFDDPLARVTIEFSSEAFQYGCSRFLDLKEQRSAVAAREQTDRAERANASDADRFERNVIERVAIEQTLRQVHWNRRKASQILGVSYKTLLNKIKESGISRA